MMFICFQRTGGQREAYVSSTALNTNFEYHVASFKIGGDLPPDK